VTVMCLFVDHSKLLSIVDDSITSPLDRIKCLLFARDLNSLPDAKVGDIIRFHRLKVSVTYYILHKVMQALQL